MQSESLQLYVLPEGAVFCLARCFILILNIFKHISDYGRGLLLTKLRKELTIRDIQGE